MLYLSDHLFFFNTIAKYQQWNSSKGQNHKFFSVTVSYIHIFFSLWHEVKYGAQVQCSFVLHVQKKKQKKTFEPGRETKRSLQYDGGQPDVETPFWQRDFTQHLRHSLSSGSRSRLSAQSLAVTMSSKWVWHHMNHFTLWTEELH